MGAVLGAGPFWAEGFTARSGDVVGRGILFIRAPAMENMADEAGPCPRKGSGGQAVSGAQV